MEEIEDSSAIFGAEASRGCDLCPSHPAEDML
jgi:hypothetical protein